MFTPWKKLTQQLVDQYNLDPEYTVIMVGSEVDELDGGEHSVMEAIEDKIGNDIMAPEDVEAALHEKINICKTLPGLTFIKLHAPGHQDIVLTMPIDDMPEEETPA